MFTALRSHVEQVIYSVVLGALCSYSQAQKCLSAKQIADAKALGKRTHLPLSLGTLVHADMGGDFLAFLTLPEQRIAYAESDLTSSSGSQRPDPLQDDLQLNRLRVTGTPYPSSGRSQHNSREIALCDKTGKECISPSRQVLDTNQAVAEFDMSAVNKIAASKGVFLLNIKNDVGQTEPQVLVTFAELRNIRPR